MKYRIYIKIIAAILAAGICLTGCSGTNQNQEKALTYRKAGIHYMEAGDYEAALKAFQNALDQSNGRITDLELDICYYKAKTLTLQGDIKGALATYNAILDYDEDNVESYYLRGVLYLKEGQTEEALDDFDKAVAQNTSDYELYMAIYDNLKAIERESDGIEYLKKALDIKAEDADAYCGMGRIYFLLGDYENARINLDKAINNGSEQAKLYMAEYLEAIGDTESAYAVYESYAERHEDDAEAQKRIGTILMEQGKYKKALEYFEKCLAIADEEMKAETQKQMILIYEAQGNFAKAFNMAGEYLKAHPNDAEIQREYEFLRTRK